MLSSLNTITKICKKGLNPGNWIISLFIFSIVFVPSVIFVNENHFLHNVIFVWLSITIFLCLSIKKRPIYFHFSKLLGYVLFLILIILIRNYQYISTIAPLFIAWIALVLLLNNRKFNAEDITGIMVIFSIAQIVICALQWSGIISSKSHFIMTGTFENPSGLSIFLTISFVFIIDEYSKKKQYTLLIILSIITAFMLIIASRSGIITLIVITYIYFCREYKSELWHFLLFFGVLLSLFFFKPESSLGRSLIIWGCKDLILNDWLFGSGIYGFMSRYMEWQSEYFQTNADSSLAMLAGNTLHPLNEYIALAINTGMLGLFALILVIISIIHCCRRNINTWTACVIAIGVQSCFTYSFRYAFVWFFVALSLSQIMWNEHNYIKLPLTRLYTIGPLALCAYALMQSVQQTYFEYRWGMAFNNIIDSHSSKKNIAVYSELANDWDGKNPFFLYNLAAVQHLNMEYEESNRSLMQYNSYVTDYNSAILRADNFYNNGEYENAVNAYKKASFMCPSKFIPLQGILNSYHALGDSSNLRLVAEEIIRKPIKIPSRQTSIIKSEAKTLLKKL